MGRLHSSKIAFSVKDQSTDDVMIIDSMYHTVYIEI